MPHIHTEPGQHDVTISAYIVREIDGEWCGLVHMHKRIDKLMQIGGHLELNETPMQCLAKEIREESGYAIDELDILQPSSVALSLSWGVTQPVALLSASFLQSQDHYHDDYMYVLVARQLPSGEPSEGESTDLRWLSLAAMRQAVHEGVMLPDALIIYEYILGHIIDLCAALPLSTFSEALPETGHSR